MLMRGSIHSAHTGKVGKLIGLSALLLKLSLAQRVTLGMEVLDVGTDGTAYFSVVALDGEGTCGDDVGSLATVQLAVLAAAVLLQAWRWLFLRREYSRAQDSKARAMKLALTAVLISLLEDIPQAVIVFSVASSCAGGMGWTLQASLAVAFTSAAWKLLTPLLLYFDFLE